MQSAETKKFTALGLTCGIGSMLVGARQAGFEVTGNIEWRKYYHQRDDQGRNTFTENFPGAVLKEKITDLTPQEVERVMNPTLALSHPECGRYSHLDAANKKTNKDRGLDPADIPLAVDLFAQVKPRFFVMDDLPASLAAFPMKSYAEKLPEYDLFPEWVSNWGYGNVQKYRNRMFMVGALKSEEWAFVPSENPHSITVADVLGDLADPRKRKSNIANHEPQDMTVWCSRALGLGGYHKRNTWAEVRDYFAPQKPGATLHYVRDEQGSELALRIGFYKHHWNSYSGVLTGGNAAIHGLRNDPYTIRERARIQGFPDDFIFYGTEVNERGEWNHDDNLVMVKQTGKAMPVQFCEYASHQVMLHCLGKQSVATNTRVLRPNAYVDEAKKWYCREVGYADQERACSACWLRSHCTIRTEKYGIGVPISIPRPEPKPKPKPPKPPPPQPAAERGLSVTRKVIETKVVEFG